MGTSFTLFRIFGIDMRVHWTFVLILAYGAFAFGDPTAEPVAGAIYGIIIVLLLFLCVTLHEFGHALVAQYFGVKVPHITLLPIGGVASLERMPDRPFEELVIAIAGPLVNFALVIIMLPLALIAMSFSGGSLTMQNMMSVLGYMFGLMPRQSGINGILFFLVSANLWLGLFNLLPAFPMDGGRILRALLAMSLPYVRATRIASFVGRGMAGIFALIGIFGGVIGLLLIAFFVYIGAGAERDSVESKAVLRNVLAREALTPSAINLYSSERVSRAVDLIMNSYQTDYPVRDLASKFVGVLTRARLIYALKNDGPDTRVVDVMLPADRIPTCSSTDDLSKVWESITGTGVRAVAVKDGGDFKGLITIDDITEVFQVLGAAMDGGTPLRGAGHDSDDAAKGSGNIVDSTSADSMVSGSTVADNASNDNIVGDSIVGDSTVGDSTAEDNSTDRSLRETASDA